VRRPHFALLPPALCIVVWLGLASQLPPFVLPGPAKVAERIVQDAGLLASDAFVTLTEASLGLAAATLFAAASALGFQASAAFRTAAMPWAVAMKSVPVVAIAPLLVLWAGTGLLSKVFLVSLVCFFPLLVTIDDGLSSLPRELRLLCDSIGAKKRLVVQLVQIPYATAYFVSGLKVAAPLAVVGAVVSEYSGARAGLGHRILLSAYRADATALLANTIVCAVVGYLVYQAASLLGNTLLYRNRAKLHVA